MIQNCLKLIDGKDTVHLKSSHQHDFRQYVFKDGTTIFLDGGPDSGYIRVGGNFDESCIENYHLTEKSTIEEVLEKLVWISNGKDGKGPRVSRPIKDLDIDHLEAILDWDKNNNIGDLYKFVIKHWIEEKRK